MLLTDLEDHELLTMLSLAQPLERRLADAKNGKLPPDGPCDRMVREGLVLATVIDVAKGDAKRLPPGTLVATDRRGLVVKLELTAQGRAMFTNAVIDR